MPKLVMMVVWENMTPGRMRMTLYTISHFIQPWLLPPGFICLIILIGLITCLYSRVMGTSCIIIGLLILWLLSTPAFTYQLMGLLQNKYPILQPSDLAAPQDQYAIVVLGGGDRIEAEYNNKHVISDFTLHRVNYAAYLHNKMNLPLILSGGKTPGETDSEAMLMDQYLQTMFHIKAEFIENKSLTTADESRLIVPLLKENKLKGVYLVTHAWHMPRSVYIFQCAGINVIPAPMGHYVYGPGFSWISYLPNMDAFYASSLIIHEFIGMLWYHLYYGKQCVKSSSSL